MKLRIEAKAVLWWRFLGSFIADRTPRERQAHLWTVHPSPRATAEYGGAERRQHEEEFGKFGSQDREADTRLLADMSIKTASAHHKYPALRPDDLLSSIRARQLTL